MLKVNIIGIDTSTLPRLTSKESDMMLKKIKNGESEYRETFLLANARLVLSMVQRFSYSKSSADDLFQVGMLGLIKALDNFDITLDVRFSTYAVPMVLGEIRRFIRESSLLKIGRNLRDVAYKAILARDQLEIRNVQEASLTEVAEEINIPYQEVVSALDAISDPISIFEPALGNDMDGLQIIDQLRDTNDNIDYVDLVVLRESINKLPSAEKNILLFRYFQGKTQTEIAKALSISQAQVSRLEKSAVDQLRVAFD
jgi:RNA polymerase sporulation-specific sigma factor